MNDNEIYKKLSEVFFDVFDDESILLTPELTAKDIDEWDSLGHIRLIVSVEKFFSVKFTASEVGALKNVGEFVNLIKSKL
jgi:acyl carrier protein